MSCVNVQTQPSSSDLQYVSQEICGGIPRDNVIFNVNAAINTAQDICTNPKFMRSASDWTWVPPDVTKGTLDGHTFEELAAMFTNYGLVEYVIKNYCFMNEEGCLNNTAWPYAGSGYAIDFDKATEYRNNLFKSYQSLQETMYYACKQSGASSNSACPTRPFTCTSGDVGCYRCVNKNRSSDAVVCAKYDEHGCNSASDACTWEPTADCPTDPDGGACSHAQMAFRQNTVMGKPTHSMSDLRIWMLPHTKTPVPACVSVPSVAMASSFCTNPNSRKVLMQGQGKKTYDAIVNVPPFSWNGEAGVGIDPINPYRGCLSSFNPSTNTDKASTAADLVKVVSTSCCGINTPYCESHGMAYHQGDSKCYQSGLEVFIGMIFGSYVTHMFYKFGFHVWNALGHLGKFGSAIKSYIEMSMAMIDQFMYIFENPFSWKSWVHLLGSGYFAMYDIAKDLAHIIGDFFSGLSWFRDEFSGLLKGIWGGVKKDWDGFKHAFSLIEVRAGQIPDGRDAWNGNVHSDGVLKRRLGMAIHDYAAEGVHLHEFEWTARAKELYGYEGRTYGFLSEEIDKCGYGHVLSVDPYGRTYVNVATLSEECDERFIGTSEASDPVYYRMLLVLVEPNDKTMVRVVDKQRARLMQANIQSKDDGGLTSSSVQLLDTSGATDDDEDLATRVVTVMGLVASQAAYVTSNLDHSNEACNVNLAALYYHVQSNLPTNRRGMTLEQFRDLYQNVEFCMRILRDTVSRTPVHDETQLLQNACIDVTAPPCPPVAPPPTPGKRGGSKPNPKGSFLDKVADILKNMLATKQGVEGLLDGIVGMEMQKELIHHALFSRASRASFSDTVGEVSQSAVDFVQDPTRALSRMWSDIKYVGKAELDSLASVMAVIKENIGSILTTTWESTMSFFRQGYFARSWSELRKNAAYAGVAVDDPIMSIGRFTTRDIGDAVMKGMGDAVKAGEATMRSVSRSIVSAGQAMVTEGPGIVMQGLFDALASETGVLLVVQALTMALDSYDPGGFLLVFTNTGSGGLSISSYIKTIMSSVQTQYSQLMGGKWPMLLTAYDAISIHPDYANEVNQRILHYTSDTPRARAHAKEQTLCTINNLNVINAGLFVKEYNKTKRCYEYNIQTTAAPVDGAIDARLADAYDTSLQNIAYKEGSFIFTLPPVKPTFKTQMVYMGPLTTEKKWHIGLGVTTAVLVLACIVWWVYKHNR